MTKKLFLLAVLLTAAFTAVANTWGIVIDPDGSANVRKGPGTKYEIVARQATGQPVYLGTKKGEWYRTYTWECGSPEPAGYISAKCITVAPKGCLIYQVKDNDGYVNVRSGASTDSDIVTRLNNDDLVFASKATTKGWRRVYNNSAKFLGYVHESRLEQFDGYSLIYDIDE